jgi:Cdc6-like AAA superfamily ATPase
MIKPTDRLLFLGASGSGKTQMIFHAVRKLHSNYVVLDSIGNLAWMRDAIPTVEYHDVDPADYNQIQTICGQLWRRAKSSNTSFTLVIDEVSEFGVGFNKQGNALRTLVRKGRNHGIGWIVSSQRIAHLDPLWLTQAKNVFVSRFLGTNDTKPLIDWSSQPMQFWQQIPIHEFSYFRDGKFDGQYFKLQDDEVNLNPTGED